MYGYTAEIRSRSLSLLSVFIRPRKKRGARAQTARRYYRGIYFKLLGREFSPLMDLWRPFVLSLLKRAGARTMGPKGSMNTPLCPLSSKRNHGWNNNKRDWRGYFQISRHFLAKKEIRNWNERLSCSAFQKTFKYLFLCSIFFFSIFFAGCILKFELIKNKDRIIGIYDHLV